MLVPTHGGGGNTELNAEQASRWANLNFGGHKAVIPKAPSIDIREGTDALLAA